MTAPYMQFVDSSGDVLAGGKVYTYASGTSTPKATYTDQAAGTPHANPVVLDSAGRAQIWITGSYKFVVKDSADTTIETTDVVASFATSSSGSVDDITTDFTEDVVAVGDSIIFSDVSDSGATKRDTVQGLVDLTAAGLTLLSTATASASATVDFTSGIDSTYDHYTIEVIDVVPATDGDLLWMRTAPDTTPTIDSAATDYDSGGYTNVIDGSPAVVSTGSEDNAEIAITGNIGNVTNEGANATIVIYNPAGTALYKLISFQSVFTNSSNNLQIMHGAGRRTDVAVVASIRFLMSTGNITSGEFKLYGVKK